MAIYKEIVTKAIIGKGKRVCRGSYSLISEINPDTVLGCWVINHRFEGVSKNGIVVVNGSFDINVWYSYDNDTKTGVSTKTFNYEEKMNVRLKDNQGLDSNSEIIVRSLRQPTVVDVSIENTGIIMQIEMELGLEIVGNTKVRVSVEEESDDYEIIEDEELSNISEIDAQIDKEIDDDFIK